MKLPLPDTMKPEIDSRTASIRFAIVTGLIVLLMGPLALVSCVVTDRHEFRTKAIRDIGKSWGGMQRLAGPMIVIPFVTTHDDSEHVQQVAIMPKSLEIDVASRHEMRKRAIYRTPVFLFDITASGVFDPVDLEALSGRFGSPRLAQASLVVGVTDTRGLRGAGLQWNSETIDLAANDGYGPVTQGLKGALAEAAIEGGTFSLALELRGTGRFSAVPVGDRSRVTMTSTWPHPSFVGRYLPDERQISANGFSASWTTNHLARGFPSVLATFLNAGTPSSAKSRVLFDKDMGFSAFEPVNLYTSVKRSLKYGVLFVVLTLVGVLCLELTMGLRFHYVQYGVVGMALPIFFITLLALAEHIGFSGGYAVAATLLTGMIAGYAYASKKDLRLAALTAVSLAGLYGVLYVLLQLESFALLVGAAVLLLMLGLLMAATRKLAPDGTDGSSEAG